MIFLQEKQENIFSISDFYSLVKDFLVNLNDGEQIAGGLFFLSIKSEKKRKKAEKDKKNGKR